MLYIAILLLLMAVVIVFAIFTLYAIYSNAPYVPTHSHLVEKMLDMAKVRKGDVVIDLGAGDGRIVVAAARRGARAIGYEINPILVLIGNWRIWMIKRGLSSKSEDSPRWLAGINWKNFWKQDLSSATVITIFGFPNMMGRLENKLQKELRPGSRVVSHAFKFPSWQSVKREDGVLLYVVE